MKDFWSFWEKLDRENRVLKLGFLSLLIIFLAQSFLVIYLYNKKTVVILPPKIDREIWVTESTVSKSYLEQAAYYIADRILNVSPQSIDNSIDSILPFFTTQPEALRKIKEKLTEYINQIKENDISQAFYPMRFSILKDRTKRPFMRVEGILKRISGDIYIGQEKAVLDLYFTVKNGRLIIYELEKKP